jgi:hypothetical protein
MRGGDFLSAFLPAFIHGFFTPNRIEAIWGNFSNALR